MKIKNQLWLLLAFVMFVAGCKKTGDSNKGDGSTVTKYLVNSIVVSKLPSATLVTTTTTITYDEKKRKKTEKIDDGSANITYEYTYYDNGKLFGSAQRFGDGNVLRYNTEYTYTGSLLTRAIRKVYKNNEETDVQINDYIYDGSNRLTEDHYVLGAVRLYTYDSNNNVIKIEDRRNEGTITTVNTYDANNRRITTSQTSTVTGLTPTSATYTYDSHNNVTKSVSTSGSTTFTVNKTYVYDADGYTTSFAGDDGGSGTYTYITL
jgi:hypothetical protein